MFRKNLMEFFIGLSYYFILLYKWLYPIVTSLSRMFYGHMICLLKFPCYLYLDPIVYFDVVDQMFKCAGNYFLLGALITTISLGMIGYWRVLFDTKLYTYPFHEVWHKLRTSITYDLLRKTYILENSFPKCFGNFLWWNFHVDRNISSYLQEMIYYYQYSIGPCQRG